MKARRTWQALLGLKIPRFAFTRLTSSIQQRVVSMVDGARRAAFWLVIGTFISTIGLLAYTATHLTLDTNPLNLLDPKIPFRQLDEEFGKGFPQLEDLLVGVIEAKHPTEAEKAADTLAWQLRQHTDLFSSIYQPGNDAFFDRTGLLYLDIPELWLLEERLAQWEPFLGTLTHDPSLRGLFSVLGSALDHGTSGPDQKPLRRIIDSIGDTMEAQFANRPSREFWREAMLENLVPQRNAYRQFVLVKPRLDFSRLQAAESPIQALRLLVKELEARYDVRIRLTGSPAIQEEERQTLAKGAGIAALLSFILVCAILLAGLRSIRLVGAILVTLLMGLIWTGAFATFLIGSLNLISATVPVLLIGLGVDFGIQFGMRYREDRNEGILHTQALRRTASSVGVAMILSALTAALIFFSFLPTSYRGLAELGLIAGMGMFLTLLANLTVLPALLTLWPVRVSPQSPQHTSLGHPSQGFLNHRRTILGIGISITAAAAIFLPDARFDFNPLNLKDPNTEAVATFEELLRDPKTTPYTIQILTKNLAAAQELGTRLNELTTVENTVTLANFVPHDQEEKLAVINDMALMLQPIMMPMTPMKAPSVKETILALDDFQTLLDEKTVNAPDDAFRASLIRVNGLFTRLRQETEWPHRPLQELHTRLLGNLPENFERLQRLLSAQPVTLQDLPPDLTSRYMTADGRVRLEVFPSQDLRNNQALRRFVQAVQAIAPNAIGTPVVLIGAGDAVVQACLQAMGLAFITATVLLFILLRNLREIILVFFPLLLTLILTIAATVVLQVPFNLANVIALPLVLGLSMAFGIYLVLRTREGISIDRLMQSSTAHAVLYSALTTMASFGTLGFSSHRGMSGVGILLSLALAIALLCSLVMLPAVLAEMESRKSP